MTFSYSQRFSGQCPPPSASRASGLVYRGVPKQPLSENDFLSHVELGRSQADPDNCNHWGLSVWRTREAVEHARRISRHMRQWSIAVGELQPADGVIAPTPSNNQPEHFTFWKIEAAQITSRFALDKSFDRN